MDKTTNVANSLYWDFMSGHERRKGKMIRYCCASPGKVGERGGGGGGGVTLTLIFST